MCCSIGPDGVPVWKHLVAMGVAIILIVSVPSMIYLGSFTSSIWYGVGTAILYPGICCLKQNETDDICSGVFLLACGIAALLLGIFNVTLILEFNLVLGSCFGIPFILSGLFCVSNFVFKRKEYEDNAIFYHRYMYISGFITAITCAFLVAFGVVPFATVASLAGPFVCVSLCFFFHRLVCFIQCHCGGEKRKQLNIGAGYQNDYQKIIKNKGGNSKGTNDIKLSSINENEKINLKD